MDGHLSDPSSVNMGVPQGSILGPLLILRFLNDLPSITENCETNMFADDTELDTVENTFFSHKRKANLNNDLNNLKEYLDYDIQIKFVYTKHMYSC